MAGELTREEKQELYSLASQIESFDPGLAAFSDTMVNAEGVLNNSGGYDSMSYRGTLIELNENWEYLDHPVKLTGRVYIKEEGIAELAPGEWNGPYEDELGTYFWVDEAELVSLGIFDAFADDPGEVSEDGAVSHPVRLAFGFNPEDLMTDVPVFYAVPGDILRAQYDEPTFDGVYDRLHHHFPRQMKIIERRIDKAEHDPQKLIDYLKGAMKKDIVQQACLESEDFVRWLAKYLQGELQLDRDWPYLLQIQGEAMVLGEDDDDDSVETIAVEHPTTLYLRVGAIDVPMHQKHGKNDWAEIAIGFITPSGREKDEADDTQLIVPLRSIRSIQSTRPAGSFSEALQAALPSPPEVTKEVDVAYTESVTNPISLPERLIEFKRLERLNALLEKMKKDMMVARRARFNKPEDALEVAGMLSKSFFREIVALGLHTTDLIRVSGQGVVKANATITTGLRKLHLDVDTDTPLMSPHNAADTLGCYESILAEVDHYEDEDGTSYWTPIVKIILKSKEVQVDMTKDLYNFPLLSTAIKSSTSARLDDSVVFEVPEYERTKQRNESLAAMALSHREHPNLSDLNTINQAFLHESPSQFTDGKAMIQRVRRLARRLQIGPDEVTLTALRYQLLDRKVMMVADAWFGPGFSEAHVSTGVVTDVFFADLPNGTSELVAALASDDPDLTSGDDAKQQVSSQLVVLRTLESLRF